MANITDNLFTFIFETKRGTSILDEPAPEGTAPIIFTKADADRVISDLTTNEVTTYTNVLHKNPSDTFTFNYYSAGGYVTGTILKSKSLRIVREFKKDNKDIKAEYERNFPNSKHKSFYIKKKHTSSKDSLFSFDLDYAAIKKLGWATDPSERNKNKTIIKQRIGLGRNTKYTDMPRIIKIMAFLLARERGYLPTGKPGYPSSEELMQREFGIMCWAMINMCNSKSFGTKGDLLKLLKYKGYSNFKEDVKENETAETPGMITRYNSNNTSAQNLEYFILAFFDGWINEELLKVTNWDHITSGITKYSGFHLPKTVAANQDPELGKNVKIEIFSDEKLNTKVGEISVKLTADMINMVKSLGTTATLDGNVLFTSNAPLKDLDEEEYNERDGN